MPIPSSNTVGMCVCVCVCVCVYVCLSVISVTVKCPVLPPCVVDGRSRNPLYYYIYIKIKIAQRKPGLNARMGTES